MGRHHALLGGVVWLGVGALSHMAPEALAASTGTCAAAAILPDIDEPGSTVAHLCGPVTEMVAFLTKRLSGGHRHATHSALAVAAAGALGLAVTPWSGARAVLLGLLLALFFRVLAPPPLRYRLVCFAAGGIAAWTCVHYVSTRWLAPALPAGVALHLVGDMLTEGGVPLLWPNLRHFSCAVLGHTHSLRESVFGIAMWAAFLGLALVVFGGHELGWLGHLERATRISCAHLPSQLVSSALCHGPRR
ncbi:MAG: metal-dependent hydrolase [Acidimicrobiales bacterium]|jgi:membrane-bound metal-dependent hydrolase YbcI (DUF457 family)